jgi:uroporphyrinogen decarboxylase
MVQVFDSWAGELGPASYKEFSEPYLKYIADKLPGRLASLNIERVPMIVFPKGAWHALDAACSLGYDVVGMDWLHSPADAVKIRGSRKVTFQGNADPGILYGTKEGITRAVQEMVDGFWAGSGNKGWIANLGHGKQRSHMRWHECLLLTETLGITPGVDPENLRFYFEEIHRLTKSS